MSRTPDATTIVHSVRVFGSAAVDSDRRDGWAVFEGGRVSAVGAGGDAPRAERTVDGEGGCLVPGFVDIHGHGGGGASFDAGPDAIRTARALHRSHGTTRAVVSLVTAAVDDLATRVAMIADLCADDPTILGSHLEGPFLDPGHKGAHTPSLLRAPDAASVDQLLAAGRGTIRQVTLAPELPGAFDAIRRFADAGVVVAVGHTDADAETTRRAFDAGATLLTHAFNAMPGIHHRAPGPVVAGLRDERVTLELIADGVHVDLALVATMFAVAGDRIALITDAMAAAGARDGRYDLGGLAVTVTDGVARLDEGGAIAGSTLTQDAAVRNVAGAGVPLTTAVHAASAGPARAIGRPDLGRLDPGALADAVLLDAELTVRRVWVAGRED
ncbi:N-acetylglucosamine-6-phosphate deacetylase [Microbacterium sp. M3]|uniref:N-acetylglucosamine-6-phosphate deacetylase n=2 Tax=Microbacterium arthrosphaerae TaxID=792652 RepID=A0ABU4H2C3_9MICO|nr:MULTISPECIES: N-acetylglucosamine-6-phosphate deacetylase [Microbacterium]MDW4573481.1 N-acetylglucosamine-6-phosphate deacetylase [Microbacterium arthrosphaerae]MDW7607336.1 N-acetylglucosamine-6-phosphate deacetylase [Microbacterium sp. M3]